jgi:hypothetical protein
MARRAVWPVTVLRSVQQDGSNILQTARVEFPVYQGIYTEFFRFEGLEARHLTKLQRKLRRL